MNLGAATSPNETSANSINLTQVHYQAHIELIIKQTWFGQVVLTSN